VSNINKNKKVLFLVAPLAFRDEEYFQPRVILLSKGIQTFTSADTKEEEASGVLGGKARIDLPLKDIKSRDYDALVLCGGKGAKSYFHDKKVHELTIEFFHQNKVLAAICIAPSILANAGILKGKKACSFPTERENLVKQGAVYSKQPVVRDGQIITARGPEAAAQFGEEIVNALQV